LKDWQVERRVVMSSYKSGGQEHAWTANGISLTFTKIEPSQKTEATLEVKFVDENDYTYMKWL
jgi:hypothetical protein